MAGAGTVGVGGIGSGVGVGGWQIYENANPTLDRQLSENYRRNFVKLPLDENVSNDSSSKFTWKKWGCVDKLFPGVEIKYEEPESSSQAVKVTANTQVIDSGNKRVKYFENTKNITNDFLTCALLDKREGANRIYFKSEVAVRDKEHGWVMWNGLSATADNRASFEYRLILLEKSGEKWTVKSGWGWNNPQDSNDSKQLVIKLPEGQYWTRQSRNIGKGYWSRETWSGIGRVDGSSGKHLLETMKIYAKDRDEEESSSDKEFFGNEKGRWHSGGVGYQKTNRTYKDGEWKRLESEIELGDSLEEWYKPFLDKKVRWTTCDSFGWSRKPQAGMSDWDKSILDVCYSKKPGVAS